jgi:myo-inositol-1(or 4)-monophosphatase
VPEASFARERALAEATAREAGALLRGLHGNVRDVRHKGEVDLVTEADKASEALIAERLLTAFPNDSLLAEEGTGSGTRDAERLWIVDPLDGTTNFAHGHPVFAVSIALMVEGQVQVGVVYDPLRDELFAGTRGQVATLNGAPLHVSSTEHLVEAMLATGFAYDPEERPRNLPFFGRFAMESQAVRREGAAALDLCYVACGRFDGYWERAIAAWDVAAAGLLLELAGGRLTRYDGGAFDPFARELVASNGRVHQDMLRIIAEVVAIHGLPPAVAY